MSNKDNRIVTDALSSRACINVGFGNFVLRERIVAVLEPGSLPMKRLREKALDQNQLIDATAGRKTRSIMVTDAGFVVLSALSPQTLQERLIDERRLPTSLLEPREGEFVS